MKFETAIETRGKSATGFRVPPAVVDELGQGKRPPVRVTINGHTYRSSVAVMGGDFMVGVSAENRALTGVTGGDVVEVELTLDTEPRVVPVPHELAALLNADRAAARRYESLSYSAQQRLVLPIDAAKTPETRKRRVAKAYEALT